MDSETTITAEEGSLAFFQDQSPDTDDFLSDVIKGLTLDQKRIAPKYFYDERGSELFDQICKTEEYYVTRTEMALLQEIQADIAQLAGERCRVIEFGAGSSVKIKLLLEGLKDPSEFIAIDISGEHLKRAVERLADEYPTVRIGGICADFTKPVSIPQTREGGKRLGFLPGSTIGNFSPPEAERFLANARETLGPGGALLIGVDLKKDTDALDAAYNDKQGYTAEFNLNLLQRMKTELGAAINVNAFEHQAFYNARAGRIEMHLRAKQDESLRISGREFTVKAGETIHTENSYKYSVKEFAALAKKAGFSSKKVWTDKNELFSIHYLTIGN